MKSVIKYIKITKNPFILFSPFLILYLILILIFANNKELGDEIRYLTYAENLINGFYSPPPPHIDLGNGPGYSLILVPFIAIHLPLLFLKLLNGAFFYVSIVFLFKSLLQIVSLRFATIFSLIWAFYPNFYELMFYTLSDVFAASLIPILLFAVLKTFKNDGTQKAKKIYTFFAGIIFGYIALTKPIFGYVLMCMIAGTIILIIFNRNKINYKKSLAILLVALATTIPYLVYTYSLSGKIFYWSSFGGNNLYWMTSPYEGEYGDWMEYPAIPNQEQRIPGSEHLITLNHQKDFDEILKNKEVQEANIRDGIIEFNLTKGIAQDELLKTIALNNIRNHPIKFVKNCFSNIGRILFNFPYSYKLQKPETLIRLPVNGIIIVLMLFCLIPTFKNWKKLIFPIRFFLFFGALYFGGSVLGSAESRMFFLLVPVLLLWIPYILFNSVRIKIKW